MVKLVEEQLESGPFCEDCSCNGMYRFDQNYRLVLRVSENGMNVMPTAEADMRTITRTGIAC